MLFVQKVNLSADLWQEWLVLFLCFTRLYSIPISIENLQVFPLHLALSSFSFPSLKSMKAMAYGLTLCNIFPSKWVMQGDILKKSPTVEKLAHAGEWSIGGEKVISILWRFWGYKPKKHLHMKITNSYISFGGEPAKEGKTNKNRESLLGIRVA